MNESMARRGKMAGKQGTGGLRGDGRRTSPEKNRRLVGKRHFLQLI